MESGLKDMVVCDLSDIMNEDTAVKPKTCNCGKSRRLSEVEVFCSGCYCWYHSCCVENDVSAMAPFSTNYNFVCRDCSHGGVEYFRRKEAGILELCHTALANLFYHDSEYNKWRDFYHLDVDIVPFIESHWDSLTTIPKRPKNTWRQIIYDTLIDNKDIFICITSPHPPLAEVSTDIPMYFSLNSHSLSSISPLLFKSSQMQYISDLYHEGSKRSISKKESVLKSKPKKDHQVKLNSDGFPLEHPFNREGYCWHYAVPDPNAPFQDRFEECLDTSNNKPIPSFLYRIWQSSRIHLSYVDRAHQLKMDDNMMGATGSKGYSSVRATHGVSQGTWYWECAFTSRPDDSQVRLGFSRRFATAQAPCGYDELSYSWRSLKGTVFHNSRGKHFSEGFDEGDVLGFMIHMPNNPCRKMQSLKTMPLMRYRGSFYFEEKVELNELKKDLDVVPNSYIELFKNGVSVGVAFRGLYDGEYFPAISIYKNATVTANFGPHFSVNPITETEYKPFSDVVFEYNVESTFADALFFVDKDDICRLFI